MAGVTDPERLLGGMAIGATVVLAANKLAGHLEAWSWLTVLSPLLGWWLFLVLLTFLAAVVLPFLGRRFR